MRIKDPNKGIFPIGVVADMAGISQRQLRIYEQKGIILPARSEGNRRLYSQKDVELLTYIHFLVSVRRVNLAGIKVILEITQHMNDSERTALFAKIEREIDSLSDQDLVAFETANDISTDDLEDLDDTPPEGGVRLKIAE